MKNNNLSLPIIPLMIIIFCLSTQPLINANPDIEVLSSTIKVEVYQQTTMEIEALGGDIKIRRLKAQGSAVCVYKDLSVDGQYVYLFITANHVVNYIGDDITYRMWTYTFDKRGITQPRLPFSNPDNETKVDIYRSPELEVAFILLVTTEKMNINTVSPTSIQKARKISLGDKLIVTGCSYGLSPLLTKNGTVVKLYHGILSPEDIDITYFGHLMDVHIGPGNSGGGVFNDDLEYVGVVSMLYYDRHPWLGFFVPMDLIYQAAQQHPEVWKIIKEFQ